ncbi:glycosyltransferase [bacterium]|nr:glycosyltransferase [bacterium]
MDKQKIIASIIIPTIASRFEYLKECLKSIKKQEVNFGFETIIVIGGKADIKTYENIINSDNTLILNSEPGLSKQRNCGVKSANGEIMVFIDDDVKADKYWLSNLIKKYDPQVGIVGGRVEPLLEENLPGWMEGHELLLGGFNSIQERKIKTGSIIGCNFSVRKEVLEECGLFDEKLGRGSKFFTAGEENVLIRKIKEKYKVVYSHEALAYHFIQKERISQEYINSRAYENGKIMAFMDKDKLKYCLKIIKYILSLPYLYIRFLITRDIFISIKIKTQKGYISLMKRNAGLK